MTKPPYSVMTMEEIRALPWNGFNAVSTFSGCGGSSTGYRMAGFKMLWASEFVPAAQDTYRANAAPYTVLDTRDIRDVTGGELLAACGLGTGEIDLFDGSPPCAAFSSVGKLDEGWGKVKKYSDTEQRVDDLFFEYARLIKETQPRVFVAENVAGLVKGIAKGYFLEILKELKACGYRVSARVLNAAWLGVPQTRSRLIFIGVRNGLVMAPVHPSPLPYQYTVRDVLPHLALQGNNGSFIRGGAMRATDRAPSGTIVATTSGGNRVYAPGYVVPFRVAHEMSGQWQSLAKGNVSDRTLPPVLTGNSGDFIVESRGTPAVDPETGVNLSLMRSRAGKMIRLSAGPDKFEEPRKLNLQELRALAGFPPDFVLTGTYGQRWERVGRAVPPVMMKHIATAVRDHILLPLREAGTI